MWSNGTRRATTDATSTRGRSLRRLLLHLAVAVLAGALAATGPAAGASPGDAPDPGATASDAPSEVPPNEASEAPRSADPSELLYLWAGDEGVGVDSPLSPGKHFDVVDDDDFLAVVDTDPRSDTYGKVLRTVSVPTPPTGNEPHHMQPFVPEGCETVFAGGLFSDFWFTFDIAEPAHPSLIRAITPAETPGTVPDAAFVLPNCEALATEMGGDPSTGSYPAGPHGTVVRLSADGERVIEHQLADRVPQDLACESQWNPVLDPTKTGGPFTRKTSEDDCLPSNPHGIWVRPDLRTLVTSDYAEPARLIQLEAPTADVAKMTVRHYELDPACLGPDPAPPLTDCIGEPRVVLLPDGPRDEENEGHEENVGVMEISTAHPEGSLNPTGRTPRGHVASRGAFAATMCGGALYFASDVTDEAPRWREVFDFTAAGQAVDPDLESTAGCSGGGAVVLTPDNRYLVHSIIGRDPGQSDDLIGEGAPPEGFPGMIVVLDVLDLLEAGDEARCEIDTVEEVWNGGAEADCPAIADVHVVDDGTTGGPHFFSFDWNDDGGRLAFFNYFVSETGVSGDRRVCMLELDGGRLHVDTRFPRGVDGQEVGSGCISFVRDDWPGDRGAGAGPAKPHYGLFVER